MRRRRVALRRKLKGVELAPFGLALCFLLLPVPAGHPPDAGSAGAARPGTAERWREHNIASPFGTIHAATFSLPQPLGTLVPPVPALQRASFTASDPDMTGAVSRRFADEDDRPGGVYPTINRALKGDRLLPAAHSAPAVAAAAPATGPAEIVLQIVPADDLPLIVRQAVRGGPPPREAEDLEAAARFEPFPEHDVAMSLEMSPGVSDPGRDEAETAEDVADDHAPERELARLYTVGRVYFDGGPMGARLAAVEPWGPDEAPVVMLPSAPAVADAEMPLPKEPARALSLSDKPKSGQDAVTVAGKGQVTGAGAHSKSPAERLGLSVKARAKAEKCLANAVYFEARSEPVRGQIAVAQVVINRAFSGYYPDDICGVVYQNAHRHLSCQFTFACDGIPDIVTEQAQWERAKRIARLTLDGKLWVKEVGKATHYHASYVYPYWVRSMRRLSKIGLHSFYRPRRWGDGSDEPSWSHASVTADAASKL